MSNSLAAVHPELISARIRKYGGKVLAVTNGKQV